MAWPGNGLVALEANESLSRHLSVNLEKSGLGSKGLWGSDNDNNLKNCKCHKLLIDIPSVD